MRIIQWVARLLRLPVSATIAIAAFLIYLLVFPQKQVLSIWHVLVPQGVGNEYMYFTVGAFIGLFVVAATRRQPSTKPLPTLQEIWLAGPREDPVHWWILPFVLAPVFDSLNKRMGGLLEVIFMESLPQLPGVDDGWLTKLALLTSAILFGFRHLPAKEHVLEKIRIVTTAAAIGFLLGLLTFTLSIWTSMIVHSAYDLVVVWTDQRNRKDAR